MQFLSSYFCSYSTCLLFLFTTIHVTGMERNATLILKHYYPDYDICTSVQLNIPKKSAQLIYTYAFGAKYSKSSMKPIVVDNVSYETFIQIPTILENICQLNEAKQYEQRMEIEQRLKENIKKFDTQELMELVNFMQFYCINGCYMHERNQKQDKAVAHIIIADKLASTLKCANNPILDRLQTMISKQLLSIEDDNNGTKLGLISTIIQEHGINVCEEIWLKRLCKDNKEIKAIFDGAVAECFECNIQEEEYLLNLPVAITDYFLTKVDQKRFSLSKRTIFLDNHGGKWIKTSVYLGPSHKLYILAAPIWGRNNYLSASVSRFSMDKIISCVDLNGDYDSIQINKKYYGLDKELYQYFRYNLYTSEPNHQYTEDGKELNGWELKEKWLARTQLMNKGAFLANGTFVLTHTWGGFEVYNDNDKNFKAYITNNSISAINCSPTDKNHIAIGSYDGTITIYALSDNDQECSDNTKRSFSYYYGDLHLYGYPHLKQYEPEIINQYKGTSTTINALYYLPDGKNIIFCTKTALYKYSIQDNTTQPLYECESYDSITSSALFLDAFVACGSETGDVTLISIADPQQRVLLHLAPIQAEGGKITINSLSIVNDIDNSYKIAAGAENGTVYIWELYNIFTPHQNFSLNKIKHQAPVHFVAFNDHDQLIVKTTSAYKKYEQTDNLIVYSLTIQEVKRLVSNIANTIGNIDKLRDEMIDAVIDFEKSLQSYSFGIILKDFYKEGRYYQPFFLCNDTNNDVKLCLERFLNAIESCKNKTEKIALQVNSVKVLKNILDAVPESIFVTKEIGIHMRGMDGSEPLKDRLLKKILAKIEVIQANIADCVIRRLYQTDKSNITSLLDDYDMPLSWTLYKPAPNGFPLRYKSRFVSEFEPSLQRRIMTVVGVAGIVVVLGYLYARYLR